MNQAEVNAKVDTWEAQGFKFIGNGMEAPDDNPLPCPACGRVNTSWALWEHPTKTRYVRTDSEYNPLLLNSANYCTDCGHYWVDED